MRIAPAATALLGAGLLACTGPKAPEPFPQDVADRFVELFVAADAAGLAALYTEDAQLLPPDAPAIVGRAAIQEFYATTGVDNREHLELATLETQMAGSQAWRLGSFVLKTPDGQAVEGGKFIELWKKVDGEWRIHRAMWNANAPPPAGAASDESA